MLKLNLRKFVQRINKIGNNFLLFLLQKLAQSSLKNLQADTINAATVQQKVLLKILQLQKNTDYGKKYNFATIRSVADFQKVHPIYTYDNYRHIIEHISKTNNFMQLVSEPIILFQETAGTTGQSKLIPRTKRLLSTWRKPSLSISAIVQSHFYFNKKVRSSSYRGLNLLNSKPLGLTPSGIPKGTVTSGTVRQSKLPQKIISLRYTSPVCVFLIEDYWSAYYCHLLFGLLNSDLGYIVANFASNVLEGMYILETQWQQLVNDIQFGRIDASIQLDAVTRQELESQIQPNPSRANALRAEFEQGMKGILSRIWPQLLYIQCITTGAMELYKERLQFYAADIPIYSFGYVASESLIGINLEPRRDTPAYVITPDAAFFEFIKASEIDTYQPNTVDLTSLSVGESYEIVVTTVAGLYRYRLGDVIKCVGYYHQSPMIEYQYRQGSLLNITSEKVSEKTVFTAITEAIKQLDNDCQLVDYTTSIDLESGIGKYIIYMEVSKTFESLPNLKKCRDKIEEIITDLNVVYKGYRAENRIENPQLKLMKQDTFKLLKKRLLSSGVSESQFKMPRLLKRFELVEFMESMALATCE